MSAFKSLAELLGTGESPTDAGAPPSELLDTDDVATFCRGVLCSREYRQSILNRITLGTLPLALELRFYDYAYGKPPERHEHSGKDGQPIITEVRRVIVRAEPRDDDESAAAEPRAATTH